MSLKLVYRILRQLSDWTIDGFYSEVYVEGAENVPKDGPLIMYVNLDVCALFAEKDVPAPRRTTTKSSTSPPFVRHRSFCFIALAEHHCSCNNSLPTARLFLGEIHALLQPRLWIYPRLVRRYPGYAEPEPRRWDLQGGIIPVDYGGDSQR